MDPEEKEPNRPTSNSPGGRPDCLHRPCRVFWKTQPWGFGFRAGSLGGSREHSDHQRCRDHAPQKGLEGAPRQQGWQHPGPRVGSALVIGRRLTGQPGTECLETTALFCPQTCTWTGLSGQLVPAPLGVTGWLEVLQRPLRSLPGVSCWAGTLAGPGAPARGFCVRRASSRRGGCFPGRCPGHTSQEEAAWPFPTCPRASWSHSPGSRARQRTPPLTGSGAVLEGVWPEGLWAFGATSCPWVLLWPQLSGASRSLRGRTSYRVTHPRAKAWRAEEDQVPQVSCRPRSQCNPPIRGGLQR